MNTKNLVITSTLGMSREEWLAFRNPINHVKKFINEIGFPGETPTWLADQNFYDNLKHFFSHCDNWKDFQFPTIGASEISTILGLNPYKSIIELFYEKVGIKIVPDFDNVAMFWGRELEAAIAEKWQYWDGSPEGLIENFNKDNIIRRCRRMNAYVQNKSCPWIFVSLDRVINKTLKLDEGSLECKTISGFAANMWQEGIPPMYVGQLQTQILVCEFDHGEIAILKDGRYFEVYPFDKSEQITARIFNDSQKFFNVVKQAIEYFLLATYCPDEQEKLNLFAKIDTLAPEPDGSISYQTYLNEAYNDKGLEVLGGLYELGLAKDYKYFGEQIKSLETLQIERSNKLKAFMKDAATLSFGQDGKCTWKQGEKNRTFRVAVKIEENYKPDIMKAGEPAEPTVDKKVLDKRKKKVAGEQIAGS